MKLFKAISSVVLALLVLVSSTSFIVGIHYCGKRVKNIALFMKADGCENEQKLPPCHRQKSSCCDDETLVHNADDLKASVSGVHFDAPVTTDITTIPVVISEIIPAAPAAHIKYYYYDPPLRSCDRIIEHQVFLI